MSYVNIDSSCMVQQAMPCFNTIWHQQTGQRYNLVSTYQPQYGQLLVLSKAAGLISALFQKIVYNFLNKSWYQTWYWTTSMRLVINKWWDVLLVNRGVTERGIMGAISLLSDKWDKLFVTAKYFINLWKILSF